jgi:TonB family protein
MRSRRCISRAAWACLLALAILTAFAEAENSAAPASSNTQSTGVHSRQQLQGLLDDSKRALRNLIEARDPPPPPPRQPLPRPDKLGHTMASDLQQNVMTPETQARLEALHASATTDLRAGDLPGAQLKLGELQQQTKEELERYRAITAYWKEPLSPRQGDNYADVLRTLHENGIDWPRQNEINSLLAEFEQQIASRDFIMAMQTTFPPLGELLTIRARELSDMVLSSVDSGGFQGVLSRVRTRACTPAKRTSGSDTAAPNPRAFRSFTWYYPPNLRRQRIEGGSWAFVIVDAKGCPERAIVVGPSTHKEFDEATLQALLDGGYFPAEKEGRPVRNGITVHIGFTNQ